MLLSEFANLVCIAFSVCHIKQVFIGFKSNQISLFLTQLQLQQNELKLNTQNAQSREKSLKLVIK